MSCLPPVETGKFRCAMCKGVFDEGQSEEEALEELLSHFGNVAKEECDVVCDDCWKKIHPGRN